MTTHGDPKWAFRNAIERARGINDQKIDQGNRGVRFNRHHIHNQEAYDAACKFNAAHGLMPRKRPDETKWLGLYRNRNVKPPTLAGPDLREKKQKRGSERLKAETRMAQRICKAVEMLEFGIIELMECPDVREHNTPSPCADIGYLVSLTQQLARAGKMDPPQFNGERRAGQHLNNKRCINCGSNYNGLHCHNCTEMTRARDEKIAEASAQRRSQEMANKWAINDIKKAAQLLREAERKNRGRD